MTRTATVVGAGIGGPLAAIMLKRAGYDVTLRESRKGPADFRSMHQMTLGYGVTSSLEGLGISQGELFRYDSGPFVRELSNGRREEDFSRQENYPTNNVMWNDLHDALVKRCNVTYDSPVTELPVTDVVVWADGVGSLGRKNFQPGRHGSYAGEMVLRGFAARPDSDMTWYMSQSKNAGYELVSYPCWDRNDNPKRGWTMMLKTSPEPWSDTETLTAGQRDRLYQKCRPMMHDKPFRLISESEEVVGSPQLVWPEVQRAVYRLGGVTHYLLGDALGTLTPRTAHGAQVAVTEAEGLADMSAGDWNMYTTESANDWLRMSRQMIRESLTRKWF